MSEDSSNDKHSKPNEDSKGIGFFQTILSVFAAMFGVQTQEKHKRDFEEGSAGNFIFAGIILFVIFIFTVYMVVSSVLENAGVQ